MDLRRSRSKKRSRIGTTPMVKERRVRPAVRAVRSGRRGGGICLRGRAGLRSKRGSPMLPGLDGWVGRAEARPSAIDRGKRESVKGRGILKETYVDHLDVNR